MEVAREQAPGLARVHSGFLAAGSQRRDPRAARPGCRACGRDSGPAPAAARLRCQTARRTRTRPGPCARAGSGWEGRAPPDRAPGRWRERRRRRETGGLRAGAACEACGGREGNREVMIPCDRPFGNRCQLATFWLTCAGCLLRRPRGVPDDEMRHHDGRAGLGLEGVVGSSFEAASRPMSRIGRRTVVSGRPEARGERTIVESHHRQVFRNAKPEAIGRSDTRRPPSRHCTRKSQWAVACARAAPPRTPRRNRRCTRLLRCSPAAR